MLPIDGRYAEALGDIIQFPRNDDARFWESINDNLIGGGSGSPAGEFLTINPGLADGTFAAMTRDNTEVMIRIGRELMRVGGENARVSPWVEAFKTWNREGIF